VPEFLVRLNEVTETNYDETSQDNSPKKGMYTQEGQDNIPDMSCGERDKSQSVLGRSIRAVLEYAITSQLSTAGK
jgi:hypothetical protein